MAIVYPSSDGAGGGGGSVATDTIFDAKGDLAVGTGADTAAKLPVGGNDSLLIADSTQATGLRWAASLVVLLLSGVTSALKMLDRATSTSGAYIYSAIAGRFNFFTDVAGADLVVLDEVKLAYTTVNEAATGGAVQIKFAGWNGAAYTDGLKITSTNASGYYPAHIVLRNDAYSTSCNISCTGVNGLQITGPGGSACKVQVTGRFIDLGRKRVIADVPSASTAMVNLTDLSQDLEAGRHYTGKMIVKCNNSQAAEGIKFDFDGGSATMTAFWASVGALATGGVTPGTVISTALATDLTFTVLTGETVLEFDISFTVNAGGSFIPRFAENSTAAGTATVERGSNLDLRDVA